MPECPYCGNYIAPQVIQLHTQACSKRPSREEFEQMAEKLTLKELARHYDVSTTSVRRWFSEWQVDRYYGDDWRYESKRKLHLLRVWRRNFKPRPDAGIGRQRGCRGCPAFWMCEVTVQWGLVLCEIPDQHQEEYLKKQFGVTLKDVIRGSGGLLSPIV